MNRRPVSDIFTTSIFRGPLVVPNEWSTAQGDSGNLFPVFGAADPLSASLRRRTIVPIESVRWFD
jgi:hypothetical protein